jgi:RNA polymerase sigma-70 factor (ECF subfamily)
MDDRGIVELYLLRDENAIKETSDKYGRRLRALAMGIVDDAMTAEECENDTYLDAWNAIPPTKPRVFSLFLGTITRRIALDCRRKRDAQKRHSDQFTISLQELEECISHEKSIDDTISAEMLSKEISKFLKTLPEEDCNLFVRRYWHFDSIADIGKRYGLGQSKIKMTLKRTRDKLLHHLEKEGFFI